MASAGDDAVVERPPAYDAAYYESHCGEPYRRGEGRWEAFFGGVADEIVRLLHPETALDAGCAIGFLVEALRTRGVDARGIDISEYAIAQAPETLRPYLRVGSVTDELEQRYDVVVCIEVLEHISAEAAEVAVANFARHTDNVLFSSTPDDHDEPTHVNVQPTERWVRLFARHGFLPAPEVDARFVTPHAVLLRRADPVTFAGEADTALRVERERAAAAVARSRELGRELKVLKKRLAAAEAQVARWRVWRRRLAVGASGRLVRRLRSRDQARR